MTGCGGDDDRGDTTGGAAGAPDGGSPVACAVGEIESPAGGCQPPGVPSEQCASGFVAEGGGCRALLPEAPCAPGLMAVPGETSCQSVAPCGEGTWGDIPIDATTQFVDGAYAGLDSDGSASRPWVSVAEAVIAAEPGAILAVAAGTYQETVELEGKPVRLWGRCPELVEIAPQPGDAALIVNAGAGGSEVRSLAIAHALRGISVQAKVSVLVSHVWVHDTEDPGLVVIGELGETEVHVVGSLFEDGAYAGVGMSGGRLTLEASVVRGAGAGLAAGPGDGVVALPTAASTRAEVILIGTVVENSARLGVHAQGSTARIQGSVIRDSGDRGANAEADDSGRGALEITGTVIERGREVGACAISSDLHLTASVVRDTRPSAAGLGGRGVAIWPDERGGSFGGASAMISRSLVELSSEMGVHVSGSTASLEGVLVRDTQPSSEEIRGHGINVEADFVTGLTADVTVLNTSVERSHSGGLVVLGSNADIDNTAIHETLPRPDSVFGRGIVIQRSLEVGSRSTATLRRSLVENSRECGLCVGGADVVVEQTTIRDTASSDLDGQFGDGIDLFEPQSSAIVTKSSIERSARAGLAVFGAHVELGQSQLSCNAIHLNGEANAGAAFSLVDLGGNTCGCETETTSCQVLSSSLAPPAPLP